MSETTGPKKKAKRKGTTYRIQKKSAQGKVGTWGKMLGDTVAPPDPWVIASSPLDPLLEIHTSKILEHLPSFSESKARAERETKAFDNMILWVRQTYGESLEKLREILEDDSEGINLRTAAGIVLTQLVQEQATKISRKTRAFGHHASAT